MKNSRQVVLCDASPIIFLSKLNQLELLATVLEGEIVVLECVVREVMSVRASPVELQRLRQWLEDVRIVDYHGSLFPSEALSRSDQSSLAWAVNQQADWLVLDERLLRRFAGDFKIPVIGFCGILLKAAAQGILTVEAVRSLIDTAIKLHDFRVSISVYQGILNKLHQLSEGRK
jgi:predicted nucleic acid-binding protein